MKEIEYVVSKIGLVLLVRLDRTDDEIKRHRSRIERWFYRTLRNHPTWEVVRPPEIRLHPEPPDWISTRQTLVVVAHAIDCEDQQHASAVRHVLADGPKPSVYITVMENLPLEAWSMPAPMPQFQWIRERRAIS